MRVLVYKGEKGALSVFVVPSLGKGRAPVLIQAITPGNVAELVLPVILAMRKPREPRQAELQT